MKYRYRLTDDIYYIAVFDKELPEETHPCFVCFLYSDECKGKHNCHERKVHFIKEQ